MAGFDVSKCNGAKKCEDIVARLEKNCKTAHVMDPDPDTATEGCIDEYVAQAHDYEPGSKIYKGVKKADHKYFEDLKAKAAAEEEKAPAAAPAPTPAPTPAETAPAQEKPKSAWADLAGGKGAPDKTAQPAAEEPKPGASEKAASDAANATQEEQTAPAAAAATSADGDAFEPYYNKWFHLGLYYAPSVYSKFHWGATYDGEQSFEGDTLYDQQDQGLKTHNFSADLMISLFHIARFIGIKNDEAAGDPPTYESALTNFDGGLYFKYDYMQLGNVKRTEGSDSAGDAHALSFGVGGMYGFNRSFKIKGNIQYTTLKATGLVQGVDQQQDVEFFGMGAGPAIHGFGGGLALVYNPAGNQYFGLTAGLDYTHYMTQGNKAFNGMSNDLSGDVLLVKAGVIFDFIDVYNYQRVNLDEKPKSIEDYNVTWTPPRGAIESPKATDEQKDEIKKYKEGEPEPTVEADVQVGEDQKEEKAEEAEKKEPNTADKEAANEPAAGGEAW
jgi:hypothetical protein